MAGRLGEYKRALNVADDASVAEVEAAFARMLQDEMTPEEIAKKKAEEEARAKAEEEMAEELGELRTAFGLKADAKLAEVAAAAKVVMESDKELKEGSAKDRIQLHQLAERVTALEPLAQKAVKLEEESKALSKQRFFDDQVRRGALAPADRPHFEKTWDLSEDIVRDHFKGKKDNTAVKLSERGQAGPAGEQPIDANPDPRVELSNKVAEILAKEPATPYAQAFERAKDQNPELVEQIAHGYGPPKR